MSGGDWDYLYRKVAEASLRLETSDDPVRRAFAVHLRRVAKALRSVEWTDSADSSPGEELAAIQGVLEDTIVIAERDVLRAALEEVQAGLTAWCDDPDQPAGGATIETITGILDRLNEILVKPGSRVVIAQPHEAHGGPSLAWLNLKAPLERMRLDLESEAQETDEDGQATARAQWAFTAAGQIEELVAHVDAVLTVLSAAGLEATEDVTSGFVRHLQGLQPDDREAAIRTLLDRICSLCGTALDANEDCPACMSQGPRPKGPLPSELFDLVLLSSLPESTWRGRAVFHPCIQKGEVAGWLADDLTGRRVGEECYDVGVVDRWAPDPHFADLGVIRVWFVGDSGSRLHYSASNLWTPV